MILAAGLFVLGVQCQVINGLPDSKCTPGAFDPRVTQENIHQTICNTHYSKKGSWSKTWRSTSSVTNKIKQERAGAYSGVTLPLDCYEGDHFILESAGGCPGPITPTKKPKGVKDNTWKVPPGKLWCDFTSNFWDEPWGRNPNWKRHCGAQQKFGAHDKDVVEDKIHNLICAETITLKEGQETLAKNWVEAYRKYVGELK